MDSSVYYRPSDLFLQHLTSVPDVDLSPLQLRHPLAGKVMEGSTHAVRLHAADDTGFILAALVHFRCTISSG